MWSVEEADANWHLSTISISLSVEVAQISYFLVHAKLLPLRKAFSTYIYDTPHWARKAKRFFYYI